MNSGKWSINRNLETNQNTTISSDKMFSENQDNIVNSFSYHEKVVNGITLRQIWSENENGEDSGSPGEGKNHNHPDDDTRNRVRMAIVSEHNFNNFTLFN